MQSSDHTETHQKRFKMLKNGSDQLKNVQNVSKRLKFGDFSPVFSDDVVF